MKDREMLIDKLYKKADLEFIDYILTMEKTPAKIIIANAYEIITKEDILMNLEEPDFLADNELEALEKLANPLSSMYSNWLKRDDNRMEEIRESISDYALLTLANNARRYFINPQTPRYDKDITYARENNEVYLYKANIQQDKNCLTYFEEGISKANENHQTKEFVSKWIDKFGLERCQYVLGYSMQKANYDARFSKENKMYANKFKYNDEAKNLATNVHPCLIDSAFRLSRDMNKTKKDRERER